MAEYETREGEQKIAKSSIYKKSLRVEGFPIAGNYTVTLYFVGRREERSAPVKITVSPDTPAYLTTYGSLRVLDEFGGITVMADNQYEADLYLGVVNLTSNGTTRGRAAVCTPVTNANILN